MRWVGTSENITYCGPFFAANAHDHFIMVHTVYQAFWQFRVNCGIGIDLNSLLATDHTQVRPQVHHLEEVRHGTCGYMDFPQRVEIQASCWLPLPFRFHT